MATDWTLGGEYSESCNCDYLCPCIFTNPQAPVTHDHCYALLVFRADRGERGGVALAGGKFAFVIRSGKVMGEGGWTLGVVVDAGGDRARGEALAAIASGEAGGTPGLIRGNLVSDFRGVEHRPIEFTMDGHRRAVTVPDLFSFEIEGELSRNTSGDPLYIDNTAHPANRRLALARSRSTHLHAFGLDLDMTGAGNNGHFAPFDWSG